MREDPERDRLESTWDRWQRLPLGYRINACLYVLAFIALVGLLAQVISGDGGKPRQVEVASRAPTTTRPKPTTTTTAKPAPTTTVPATTAAPKPTTAAPAAATNVNPAHPTDTTPIAGAATGGGSPTCENSSDPSCGDFSWSPPAGNNLPIVINANAAPSVTGPGQPVQFTVVVTDADHHVSDNCAVIDFGDGTGASAPCSPLNCPPTFGPWSPPVREAGSQSFSYTHVYPAPGDYTASFEFHTDRDRCPDPYGNFGVGTTKVTVQ